MLGGGERRHGVGQVEVGSDAELGLAGGGVRRGGGSQLLLPPLLLRRREVTVDQRLQELHDQLGVVRDLRLLQENLDLVKVKEVNTFKGLVLVWCRANPGLGLTLQLGY